LSAVAALTPKLVQRHDLSAVADESIRLTLEKEKIILKKLAAVLLIGSFTGLADSISWWRAA